MSPLKEIAQGFGYLLFPQLCTGCTRPLLQEEEAICTGCNIALPRTHFNAAQENDAAVRFAGRIPFRYVTSFCHFTNDGLLQHLLHRLKYGGNKGIGTFLGKQAGYSLRDSDWMASIDAIVPVPLHPKKEAARGFNQSALIASGMASILNKEVSLHNLIRNRHTESQTKKSREERVANVKDAFEVKDEPAFRNRHVLLIDDVLTTGATLESAANALLKISGLKISIATIALASL